MKLSVLSLIRFLMFVASTLLLVSISAWGQSANLSAWDLAFGQVAVGNSLSKTDTLTNSDTVVLTIRSITASGTGWSQTNNCPATLARAASCTINVKFAPTSTGGKNGAVIIASNDPSGNQELDMTGTGIAQVTVSPAALTFTAQTLNTASPAKPITLTNNGATALAISGISATGDYTQTNNCGGLLAANSGCSINVVFKPTVAGTRTGQVSISDGAAGSPRIVGLSGTGSTTVALTSIAVTPAPSSIAAGANVQLTATGTYSDSTTKDVSATAVWSTSNSTIATVNGAGLVSGMKGGSATITATSGTIKGTSALTVTKTLTAIAVAPANLSVSL